MQHTNVFVIVHLHKVYLQTVINITSDIVRQMINDKLIYIYHYCYLP